MILSDTGPIVALIDRSDRHHRSVRAIYDRDPAAWVLPWAILPEVDYLVGKYVGAAAQAAFLADLADHAFSVEWGKDEDLEAAKKLAGKYDSLRLGLVDAVVMAIAERLEAGAIATLDLRHFGAVDLRHHPKLVPRDRLT